MADDEQKAKTYGDVILSAKSNQHAYNLATVLNTLELQRLNGILTSLVEQVNKHGMFNESPGSYDLFKFNLNSSTTQLDGLFGALRTVLAGKLGEPPK